jgi:hypothetical protein
MNIRKILPVLVCFYIGFINNYNVSRRFLQICTKFKDYLLLLGPKIVSLSQITAYLIPSIKLKLLCIWPYLELCS